MLEGRRPPRLQGWRGKCPCCPPCSRVYAQEENALKYESVQKQLQLPVHIVLFFSRFIFDNIRK